VNGQASPAAIGQGTLTSAGQVLLLRPRRLRRTAVLRRLVAETRLSPADLVLPLFVKEGIGAPQPIPSMPGVQQHTVESVRPVAEAAAQAGLGGIILFGVPARKDARGSSADDDEGIVPLALRTLRADLGDSCVIIADLCLDEFTDHGHCGILGADGLVDNDATLERYASVAVCQATAGAHVVAPSGMMDGQVRAIRLALDGAGFAGTAILAYAAKYASAWYGPFRDAAECAPGYGDRSDYQQDPANGREALREVALDVAEGADAVMVKPAGSYLDVVYRVAQQVDLPVAAYQVSGEYAMVEAAAARGWIDRERAIDESLVSVRRAGADIVLTYWALEVAQRLGSGAGGGPRPGRSGA
jgi:porphobilinogen synthase